MKSVLVLVFAVAFACVLIVVSGTVLSLLQPVATTAPLATPTGTSPANPSVVRAPATSGVFISRDAAVTAATRYYADSTIASVELLADRSPPVYAVQYADRSDVFVNAVSAQVVYATLTQDGRARADQDGDERDGDERDGDERDGDERDGDEQNGDDDDDDDD